jgi:hypothetical protein
LATERAERRLAAILAADVAGYSRLMGADEEGTLGPAQGASARADRPHNQHPGAITNLLNLTHTTGIWCRLGVSDGVGMSSYQSYIICSTPLGVAARCFAAY